MPAIEVPSPGVTALWNARSIAVVGASDRPGSLGGTVIDHLKAAGFSGRIHPVHPRAETVGGLPSHAKVSRLPDPVDLALLLVSADKIADALEDCLTAAVGTVIVGASGFAETGPNGQRLQDHLTARAAAAGARLLGPNCIGAANFHTGLIASFSPMFHGFDNTRPGGLALVSHSGGIGFGIASLAAERGLRLGWAVTTGNEADITAGEAMHALAAEPDCTGVVCYLESVPDQAWLEQVAAVGKPVAAILSGGSAAGSRASVTRQYGQSDPQDAEALSRHGIQLASDVEELLDLTAAFPVPAPTGPRVAVVTTSGGAAILAADALDDSPLRLAEFSDESKAALREILPSYARIDNPLDVTASVISDPRLLIRSLSIVADDPGCDAVLVSLCVLGSRQATAAGEVIIAATSSGKPVVVSRTGADMLAPALRPALTDAGIGVYSTPTRAVNILARLYETAEKEL